MFQGILIAIGVQSLLLALICFTIPSGGRIRLWLGLCFLMIAYRRLFYFFYNTSDFLEQHTFLLGTYELSAIIELWAVDRYICLLTEQRKRRVGADWCLIVLSSFFSLFFLVAYFKGYWPNTESYYEHSLFAVVNALLTIYEVFVVLSGLKDIKLAIQQTPHSDVRLRLLLKGSRWLLYFILTRAALVTCILCMEQWLGHQASFVGEITRIYLFIYNSLLIVLLMAITYFILRNPFLVNPQPDAPLSTEQRIVMAVLPDSEQPERPSFDEEMLEQQLTQLRLSMEEQRYWLNPKLTQPVLAHELGIQPYLLGVVLRQAANRNFNTFINEYRVRHAQQLLLSEAHTQDTMYAIALDAGFASEATFYAAFRKVTGESPAAWRKVQMNS